MGLIKLLAGAAIATSGAVAGATGSLSGVLSEQWKEYFVCESLPNDVLAVKGTKKTTGRSVNTKGDDNVITNGSGIVVAEGQCMIIVENGQVVDFCAEPGEYTYNTTTEPSLFDGGKLTDNIKAVFASVGKRYTFGGVAAQDQRIYYFNTKEITGNKYGTPNKVPFRVVDERAGIDMDVSVSCFGEYSYKITNPVLFYTNVSGNFAGRYTKDQLEGQMRTELLTALQPAFAKLSEMGIRYSYLPGHTTEFAEILNNELSSKWRDLRGIEVVSVGVSSIKASEEDEAAIKEMQKMAAFMDPTRAAAYSVYQKGQAAVAAANNASGAVNGFMGMNMAQAGGIDEAALFAMGQKQAQIYGQQAPAQAAPAPAAPAAGTWTCPTCGAVCTGKFCPECGAKKPGGIKCDKCGWTPAPGEKAPKFCPNCGDPITADDMQ